MYHRGIPDGWRHPEYVRFLRTYINHSLLEKLISIVIDDNFITDYDIFESVSDFACKNLINDRIAVRPGSPLKFYYLELKPEGQYYYSMRQGWTYGINKYIMSKFDGDWIYIPKNKYTLVR